mgnify:CR=1 FL=1
MMDLDNCPCSGVNLPRFVQPVILAGRCTAILWCNALRKQAFSASSLQTPPASTGC